MIIDPNFLDHWKTRMLVDMLGDEMAPLYLIRLWAHCQNRKKTHFEPIPNQGLKALCKYLGDADKLVESLIQCEWIARSDDGMIEVLGWAEHNAQLLANWENGKKGGRPRKNPTETHGKPNPEMGKPIRVDKSREDTKELPTVTSSSGDDDKTQAVPGSGCFDRMIALWNSLPDGTGPRVKPDGKEIRKAWANGWRKPEVREWMQKPDDVIEMIRGSPVVHGQAWFHFAWLWKRESNGTEQNITKLMRGQYREIFGKKQRSLATGAGQLHPADRTGGF